MWNYFRRIATSRCWRQHRGGGWAGDRQIKNTAELSYDASDFVRRKLRLRMWWLTQASALCVLAIACSNREKPIYKWTINVYKKIYNFTKHMLKVGIIDWSCVLARTRPYIPDTIRSAGVKSQTIKLIWNSLQSHHRASEKISLSPCYTGVCCKPFWWQWCFFSMGLWECWQYDKNVRIHYYFIGHDFRIRLGIFAYDFAVSLLLILFEARLCGRATCAHLNWGARKEADINFSFRLQSTAYHGSRSSLAA